MPNEVSRARFVLMLTAAIALIVLFWLVMSSGVQLDYMSFAPVLLWSGIALALSAYCSWRGMNRLRDFVEPVGLGFLVTTCVIVSTYLAARPALPLVDERLAEVDLAIGFIWISFVRAIDARPWLAQGLGLAYQSFAFQLLALPVLLICIGQVVRAYQFVTAYALVGFSASMISIWFPAVGAFPSYGITADQLANINIHYGYFFLSEFEAVRSDPQFVLSMEHIAGIITFPSVHAAVAGLCMWAASSVPYLRYPMLILNLGMAVSAISHGSHYFVDVPAGIFLAFGCVSLTLKLTTRVRDLSIVQTRGPSAEQACTEGAAL
jgi:membrane-associated phospholipid phosphatase